MAAGEPRLGPLVRRAVHRGAALWLAASLLFLVGMVVAQLGWSGPPAYSLSKNYLSDLGNTGCGPYPSSTSPRVCSPWHDVFNGAAVALGLLVVLGAVLVRTAFPRRRSSKVGLVLAALGGVGALLAGACPENVDLAVHDLGSAMAFVLGSLALVALGLAMFRDTRWNGYRAYTVFSGLLGLVASALFGSGAYLGLGPGGMERLLVAPLLVFLIVAGTHLLRVPQFAPRTVLAPGH